jgi:hypothetical protein
MGCLTPVHYPTNAYRQLPCVRWGGIGPYVRRTRGFWSWVHQSTAYADCLVLLEDQRQLTGSPIYVRSRSDMCVQFTTCKARCHNPSPHAPINFKLPPATLTPFNYPVQNPTQGSYRQLGLFTGSHLGHTESIYKYSYRTAMLLWIDHRPYN